jgi:uncharacterized YigZ family protein
MASRRPGVTPTPSATPAEPYLVPAREARAEIRVANSVFIAIVAPVLDVDEAKAFVARIKQEFADATHNVPAYLVGHGASVVAHCHDDGEPSGTAGRPVLAVLRGSGLGDVAVVVTRYFGGTKLGTGGLVRAYGDAARKVLEVVPRARRIVTHTIQITVPYSLFERVRLAAEWHQGQVLREEFGAQVSMLVRFAVADLPAFQSALQELSNGTLQALVVETGQATIVLAGDPLCSAGVAH